VKVPFADIAQRITGFSTPFFGVSWNPPELERTTARKVVTFLEDRRVLYVPSVMEEPWHCVESVLEIRRFLTSEVATLGEASELAASLRAMRAACRKFLNVVQDDDREIARFGGHQGHWASWVFNGALGELRGVFGLHLAAICTKYGIDVEEDLAAILPIGDDTPLDETEWRRLPRHPW
jgi:hypothetical protein